MEAGKLKLHISRWLSRPAHPAKVLTYVAGAPWDVAFVLPCLAGRNTSCRFPPILVFLLEPELVKLRVTRRSPFLHRPWLLWSWRISLPLDFLARDGREQTCVASSENTGF